MNPHTLASLTKLSNEELILQVKHLAAQERQATVTLIAHLAELDARRLYLAEGCSSLFTYCTQVLHLSEHAAYGRIEATRAARRFPVILEMLEEGAITLTTVCLLASHLTEKNHEAVLDSARYQCKRQVEELIARLAPKPPVPALIRRLPVPRHSAATRLRTSDCAAGSSIESSADSSVLASLESAAVVPSTTHPAAVTTHPAVVAPLAPGRYKVQFTASGEMHEKFRLAQALLRHQIPDGNPAAIFDRALTVLLEMLTKQKLAATDCARDRAHEQSRPVVPHSRHIPAEVKRAVWRRDGGRCAFVSPSGRRCAEQGFLEFHHVVPFSAGGEASVDNIQLRCRAHNGYEATLVFGQEKTVEVREVNSNYASSEEQLPGLREHSPPNSL